MPSKNPQLNLRLPQAVIDEFHDLLPRVRAALGVPVSQPEAIALAIRALAEKYPAEPAPEQASARPARRKRASP